MNSDDKNEKTPEDLSKKCALSFLEELFYVCFNLIYLFNFLISVRSSRHTQSRFVFVLNGFIN